jgi:hypothetical protein
MENHADDKFDALADKAIKLEDAAEAAEDIPIVKFGQAFARARARRGAQTPAAKASSVVIPFMSAIKEPERITLTEGLAILKQHLPPDQAKVRVRRAFVQKMLDQEPLFAPPYDDAEIDCAAGSVKLPRKREPFRPTFRRADFDSHFFRAA